MAGDLIVLKLSRGDLRYEVLEELLDRCELELKGEGVPKYTWVAMTQDKTLVGVIGGCPSYGKGVYIPLLGVDPQYRETGIAKKLIRALFEELYEKGYEYFDATVDNQNTPALLLYDDVGVPLVPAYTIDADIPGVLAALRAQAVDPEREDDGGSGADPSPGTHVGRKA